MFVGIAAFIQAAPINSPISQIVIISGFNIIQILAEINFERYRYGSIEGLCFVASVRREC